MWWWLVADGCSVPWTSRSILVWTESWSTVSLWSRIVFQLEVALFKQCESKSLWYSELVWRQTGEICAIVWWYPAKRDPHFRSNSLQLSDNHRIRPVDGRRGDAARAVSLPPSLPRVLRTILLNIHPDAADSQTTVIWLSCVASSHQSPQIREWCFQILYLALFHLLVYRCTEPIGAVVFAFEWPQLASILALVKSMIYIFAAKLIFPAAGMAQFFQLRSNSINQSVCFFCMSTKATDKLTN